MDDLRSEESYDKRASENEEGSNTSHLNNEFSFICPRTPDTLEMRTPTKLNVDTDREEKLKKTLEKHGIERENAGDFFRGLVKDKDFKKLFMTSLNSSSGEELCNDSNDDEYDVAPMTRSKLREYIQSSPHKIHWVNKVAASQLKLPKFADISLPDNDDDDDEYCPVPAEDVISKRTRSKHSLESMSLDVLEAAFNPPDVADDICDNNIQSIDDYDWQKWLSDLMKSDLTVNIEDDNVDEDPDFNVVAELERSENEDINDSATLEVPRDELLELLEEFENPISHPHSAVLASSTPIAKPILMHDALPKKRSVKQKRKASNRTSVNAMLKISSSQMGLIEQQMQQHVQLLLQANLLCRNTVYESVIQQSEEMLHELHDISVSQMTILGMQKSYLSSCNLNEALELIRRNILPSDPVMRLHRIEKVKHHISLPSSIAEIIGNSEACMYRELLPVSAPLSEVNSRKMPCFLLAEDCLLVLGLSEVTEACKNKFEMISQSLLPGRTAKQLSARYRNVVYCRTTKDMNNPITKYHNEGKLPMPNTKVKHILSSDAQKPVHMSGDVPCWVHALKPVYKTKLTSHSVYSSDTLSSNGVTFYSFQKILSSSNDYPSSGAATIVSATPVTCVALYSSASSSKSINLQTNQISIFQTYYSINDQTSTCKMKTNEPVPTGAILDNTNPSNHGANTLTSQSIGMVTTSKVQPSLKYGRRKSAGKSIKRMRKELLSSSSSSSESEDDSTKCSKPQKSGLVKKRVHTSIGENGEDKDHLQVGGSHDVTKSYPSLTTISKNVLINNEKQLPPVGGYLQKLHPRLLGKKGKVSSKDASKIKSSAQMLKTLEDDVNVLSDPQYDEKEKIFATGYLARVQLALQAQPGKYDLFLNILKKFTYSNSSPVDLVKDITGLLQNSPDLVQGFVPFLSPAQAQECGLAQEKSVYVRARRFLRQLELQFADNQEILDQILEILNSVAEVAIYREEEILNSILNLLKGYPYLQDEFVTFFDSQPPPKILFEEDFEEVDLTDDVIKDPNAGQFEHVMLNSENHETEPSPIETVSSVKKPKKRSISQCSLDEQNATTILPNVTESKENVYPGAEALEDTVNYDSESEEVLTEDEANHNGSLAIPPPNMAMISEDALTSSPFKRITSGTESLRPRTPTGIAEITSDTTLFSISSLPPCMSSSSSFPILPPTPGKIPIPVTTNTMQPSTSDAKDHASSTPCSPCLHAHHPTLQLDDHTVTTKPDNQQLTKCKPLPMQQNDDIQSHSENAPSEPSSKDKVDMTNNEKWTRDEDEMLLTTCQRGIDENMFSNIAKKLGRNVQDVEARLHVLCDIFDESEEDNEVCSDSSAS